MHTLEGSSAVHSYMKFFKYPQWIYDGFLIFVLQLHRYVQRLQFCWGYTMSFFAADPLSFVALTLYNDAGEENCPFWLLTPSCSCVRGSLQLALGTRSIT